MLLPFPLRDGSQLRLALALAHARWELIFGKGITPDDVVPLATDSVLVDPDVSVRP